MLLLDGTWKQDQVNTMSGVAQWLACWAHNPKVPGSKPGAAMIWHDSVLYGSSGASEASSQRAVLGIEPRTSRTLSENHATRPNSQLASL